AEPPPWTLRTRRRRPARSARRRCVHRTRPCDLTADPTRATASADPTTQRPRAVPGVDADEHPPIGPVRRLAAADHEVVLQPARRTVQPFPASVRCCTHS